jgi:Fungal specific transcription factor domain
LRSPSIPLFHDETEAHYFQVYCERTATKVGGCWENDIWSRLIIQACHQEPFARHAIVSIGALDLAIEYQTPQSRNPAGDQGEYADNPHHQFALQQYGKALKLMRDSPSEDEEHHVRKALISCLLIICFETYRGDPDLAVTQAQSALQVLASWLRKLGNSKNRRSTTSAASKNSQVVGDDLINAFARLYKALMVFRAPRPIELSLLLMPEAAEKLIHMPSIFSSLEEARTYWELHLRTAIPWNYQRGFEAIQASTFPKLYPDIIHGHDPDYCPPTQGNVSRAKLDEERRLHLTYLERWRFAFASVWTHSNTPSGADDFQGAAILLLQSICGTISFNATATDEECIYDTFLPEFRQMAWLARSILERAEAARVGGAVKAFSFSIGAFMSIYYMMNKCRDRAFRRELVELCYRYP